MNAIELNHVTKHYPSFTLNDISITLPEGMIMGLVGENGAGKTTIFRILTGIAKCDEGTFSLLGCSDPYHHKEVMNQVGVVSEDGHPPLMMNRKEIGTLFGMLYPGFDAAYYAQLGRQMNIPETTPYASLSKGNQMKLKILCALSHHPQLLLFDEATSGLDPLARDELLDLLIDFTREEHHSILMSSHIVSDLEKACDYIVLLHEGSIMANEAKDVMQESWRIVHCPGDRLEQIDRSAVFGKRITPYGAELLMKHDQIPAGLSQEPASIEDIFILMTKGANHSA